MTKGSAEWFEALASAMKARDKALNGIARWQEALADTEAIIRDLTEDGEYEIGASSNTTTPAPSTAPVPASTPAPAFVDPAPVSVPTP